MMTDDHDMYEWVNISSGTSLPGLSWTVQRAVKQFCVCMLLLRYITMFANIFYGMAAYTAVLLFQ